MPSVRKRSQHQRWIFGERAYPAPEGTHESGAQDGRPTLDDGFVENADRLLDRLREVHGER